jgi:selenocysteine-specific elongation factor
MSRPISRIVVGVIGHVDHGKTALVRALTGQETDRLAEEKRRGVSIALGFAHLAASPEATVDLIDMPGHERFVRTMIAGASGIDAVLLVVSAVEGIKPQTVEHVEIAGLLGLRWALVAVSKCDLVSDDAAGLAADEAMALAGRVGLDPLPPVLTSAATGRGMDGLRDALRQLAETRSADEAYGRAYLPIDRAFAMTGHGPVVTGTLRGAGIAAGDMLELLPAGRTVRARAVQVHGDAVTTAAPGQRVAVNLRGVELSELARGMSLVEPGAVELSDWLTLSIRAVGGAPPLKNGARLHVLIGTSEAEARLRLLDRDVLQPGESGFAQLHFAQPIATPVGEHAVLRLPAPLNTVAGGKVLEVAPRRRKRGVAEDLARLAALRDATRAEIIAIETRRIGPAGTNVAHLARLSGLAPWKVSECLCALPVEITRAGLVAPRATLDHLAKTLPRLLVPHPEGVAATGLQAALPDTGKAVIEEALDRLTTAGKLVRRGSRYAVPRPEHDRARLRDAASLSDHIAKSLRRAGLTPPLPKEIAVDPPAAQAVERLLRAGVLIRAVDRAKAKELLFHREAIADARRLLTPLLAKGPGLLVGEIAKALGISRKFVMPLLDHLDTTRFTQRDGDRRRLHPSQQTRDHANDQAAQEHV